MGVNVCFKHLFDRRVIPNAGAGATPHSDHTVIHFQDSPAEVYRYA
jgi:hypothetical protein